MIFLDNAAGSWPKPKEVKDAVCQAFDQYGANPGRGSYAFSLEGSKLLFAARNRLAEFLGCENPERMVFTSGATASINYALQGFLKQGDHVVFSGMEHNAVWRTLANLENVGRITATCVKANRDGVVAPGDFEKAIRPSTRLLVCLHVSNVCGSVQPIEAIGAIAKKRGIAFMVDTAQSAGLLPVDAEKMNISLLAIAGHKALYGPTGIGALYVSDKIELSPLIYGGTGSRSTFWQQPDFFPEHLEAGSHHMLGIAGLLAGVDFIVHNGLDNIYEKTTYLSDYFIDGIIEIPGIHIYHPEGNHIAKRNAVPVVSVTLDGMESGQLAYQLDSQYDIAVRSGLHCTPLAHHALGTIDDGTTRFSFGYFNTKQEVITAIKALEAIAAQRRYNKP